MRPVVLVSVGSLFALAACAVAGRPAETAAATGPAGSGLASAPTPAPAPAPAPALAPAPPSGSASASAPLATPAATTATPASACNEQPPQDFLIRGNFLKEKDGNQHAIQWRTDHYGWFKGFGRPGSDAQPPTAFVVDTTFMGLPIKMHRKVVPALKCVEEDIKLSCAEHPYTARALAGIRARNTYRGGEVTNHAYGIAIDIDPTINTCCGCVPPWNDAPACKRPAKTEYDRMAMPECWVHSFERYGFYWLGHDVLRDTMHFEFLGDPERIARTPPGAVAGTGEGAPR
jgi:hypothetical protein